MTSFFRDPDVFVALHERVFPALLETREKTTGPIRLWVPGCSSGEELLVAIAALEFLAARRSDVSIQVFGSDVSDKAIRRARAAEYGPDIAEHVSAVRLDRFFERTSKGYRIARYVREACVFVRHDLAADPPFSRIDLLSCRNVLIYFDTTLQRHVVPLFHYALNEPGFWSWAARRRCPGSGISSRSPTSGTRSSRAGRAQAGFALGRRASRGRRGRTRTASGTPARGPNELHRALDLLLLSRYVPAAAARERRARDRPGARQDRALSRACPGNRESQPAQDDAGRPRRGPHPARPACEVGERAGPEGIGPAPPGREHLLGRSRGRTGGGCVPPGRHFVVVFRERGVPPDPARAAATVAREDESALADLQEQLAASKAYVSSVIEQHALTTQALAQSSEEMQATNEELQSANEELETEGGASVHERGAHDRQRRAAGAVPGGQRSQQRPAEPRHERGHPDRDRRSGATRGGSRRGRGARSTCSPPISGAPSPRSGRTSTHRSSTRGSRGDRDRHRQGGRGPGSDGRWQRLQIRPYQTADKRIDGAVVSLVDIDALKSALTEVGRARDFAAATLETVPSRSWCSTRRCASRRRTTRSTRRSGRRPRRRWGGRSSSSTRVRAGTRISADGSATRWSGGFRSRTSSSSATCPRTVTAPW